MRVAEPDAMEVIAEAGVVRHGVGFRYSSELDAIAIVVAGVVDHSVQM